MSIQLSKREEVVRQNFLNLTTKEDLARLLKLKPKSLNYFLYCLPDTYHQFTIKKRTGGLRTINAPNHPLKRIQRDLAAILNIVYKPRPSVHGFVKDRNVVSNAKSHIGKENVLNLDLKDFFPSINFGRVRGLFMGKPYSLTNEVATVLGQICCYENELPQGAPTSPIISNMICAKLDSEIQRLAKKFRCNYSRYADDITLSTTQREFPQAIGEVFYLDNKPRIKIGVSLETLISDNGFEINQKKVRIQSQRIRQEVTGLLVNKKPNLQRKKIRNIRAILHAWERYGETATQLIFNTLYRKQKRTGKVPNFRYVLRGRINYLKMIKGGRDTVYRRLINKYNELIGDTTRYPLSDLEEINSALWIIKCGSIQGTGFLLRGYGLITCEHVVRNQSEIEVFQSHNWLPMFRKRAGVIFSDRDKDLAILDITGVDMDKVASLSMGDDSLIVHGSKITTAGFPDYETGNQPRVPDSKIIGFKEVNHVRRMLCNHFLIGGESGSPALNAKNEVVGVVVTGTTNYSGGNTPKVKTLFLRISDNDLQTLRVAS
jgi:RNA-directed DNA polymerase